MTKREQQELRLLNKGITALIERNEIDLRITRYTKENKLFISGKLYAYRYIRQIIVNMLLEKGNK